MAREAAIRVSLRKNELKSDVRSIESRFKAAGKRIGAALRAPISAGLDSAKQSISNIGGEIRNTFKMAATLGGAITVGGAVKSAMEAQTAYLQLGDALTTFSKQSWEAADAQAMVARVADQTKIPIGDLRTTLFQLASASEKIDIEKLLERAGSQARRLGMEGDYIAEVYSRLIAKGVAETAEETENLTEQFNYLFRTMLGESLQDAIGPNDVAELAAYIGTTKNNAAEMLKLISMSGEKVKKDFGKANEVVEELGLSLGQTKGIDEYTKKLKLPKGVIDKNKTALENMIAIAELGQKKFDAYANALSTDTAGPALKHVIGVEFFEGKVSKKKWDLRIEELKKELADLGDLVVDRTKLEAADLRHKKTINADVNDAMNKLAKTFSDEKMQKAISDLSKHLPTLAEGLADLVSWIVENPWKAAAAAGGVKIGGAALAGAAGAALPAAGKALFGLGGAGAAAAGGAAGGGAAAAAGGAGAVAGGTAAAGKAGLLWRGIAAAGKGTVGGLAKAGASSAGASAGTAGAAMTAAAGVGAAAAGGALVGTIIHRSVLDPKAKADFETFEKALDVLSLGSGARRSGTDIETKQAALNEIHSVISQLERGNSWWTELSGGLASEFSDARSPEHLRRARVTDLRIEEKKLQTDIQKQWEGQAEATKGLLGFSRALGNVNEALDRLNPPTQGTSRGPSKVSNPNKPGNELRKG